MSRFQLYWIGASLKSVSDCFTIFLSLVDVKWIWIGSWSSYLTTRFKSRKGIWVNNQLIHSLKPPLFMHQIIIGCHPNWPLPTYISHLLYLISAKKREKEELHTQKKTRKKKNGQSKNTCTIRFPTSNAASSQGPLQPTIQGWRFECLGCPIKP